MEFTLVNEDGPKYLKWKGENTFGQSWCRGTNLHLRPSAGLVLNEPSHYWYEDPAANYKKYISGLEAVWNHHDLYYELSLEMDEHGIGLDLLRGDSPDEIIEELKRHERQTFEKVETRFEEANINLGEFLPDGPKEFLHESDSTLIVLFKEEALVKELETISKYGKENGVTFHWI